MKKVTKKMFVLLFVGFFITIALQQVIGIESDESTVELVDQSNGGGGCGGCEGASSMLLTEGMYIAQSFIPSYNSLSKIIIDLKKSGVPSEEMYATLIIRDALNGEDLVSLQQQINGVEMVFDFPEINVISDETYFMILMTDGESSVTNGYSWYSTTDEAYEKGNCWTSLSGTNWNENHGTDMFFRTYWMDHCPEKPGINGPYDGIAQERYEYSFNAVDPEGHDIYLYIDWGDGRSTRWIGPFASGETVVKDHQWAEPGNYSIQVKSKDVYGAVSEWSELPLSLPKEKYNEHPFQIFLDNHPILFSIIQYVLSIIK